MPCHLLSPSGLVPSLSTVAGAGLPLAREPQPRGGPEVEALRRDTCSPVPHGTVERDLAELCA